jgi:uncharacterized protein DUF5678
MNISFPARSSVMLDIANLSGEIAKYEDKWIAIDESEEKIVGVGDNAFEATTDAEQKGYPETILFKVPSFDSAFVPLA